MRSLRMSAQSLPRRGPRCKSQLPMRIVVTGGLGFVGLTLARRLVARGDIDDLVLFDAPGPAEPPEEIRDSAEIVRGDIRDGELVRTLLEGAAGVFHLASVVSAQGERD